jgi:3-isopropylmalate/(R)-2-methylmalate dehydratase small subunit
MTTAGQDQDGAARLQRAPRVAPIHVGTAAPLMLDNVDTDVISPLGKPPTPGMTRETAAFEPIRFHSDGRERTDFILNREGYRRASILIVGKNFGTGSSRGTAVSRPMDGGIRVVIGESFGPLFYDNSVQQGLIAIALPRPLVDKLAAWALANPANTMTVDIQKEAIEVRGMDPIPFKLEPRVRTKFLKGLSNLQELQVYGQQIDAFEGKQRKSRPWVYQVNNP